MICGSLKKDEKTRNKQHSVLSEIKSLQLKKNLAEHYLAPLRFSNVFFQPQKQIRYPF